MHYLIQKTTRQHIAVADDMQCPVECVKVRADAEGWAKHRRGALCPVPINSRVDVVGKVGSPLYAREARGIVWSAVACYRPECETISTAFDPMLKAAIRFVESAKSAESAVGFDTIMARAGETADDLPADTAPGHETAAMLLSIICAFAIGALIGWGWM